MSNKNWKDPELREFKKIIHRKILFIVLAILLTVAVLISYIVYTHFYSMGHLPEGKWIQSSTSPNQQYKLNIYLVNKGGATVAYSIRGELLNVSSNKRKNIYWGYREQAANIIWKDNKHVSINNRVLDVRSDTYDWRRE
ncbi:DUF5412 domain-containing protein [Bacillus sp. CLL-7-23]|uniref:DUF5412 domain-containing protein n=1 Tax=Bacillus changyiensis TaxID=3004103 RepID=A0ABT4X5J0_9BACI|nr:DUF5412 domain-containing protein [Bacillus changyiensis]MDA7027445.1 DUF5412 domain-containing protein [Bacillus changyiensis]